MPVGGEGTNCVIAAHRGYMGIPFFREIEALESGDFVYITNPWGTLKYEVVKYMVTTPDDTSVIRIIPGQDMVTLITCHPYTLNYDRYVVYCVRAGDGFEESAQDGNEAEEQAGEQAVYGTETVSQIEEYKGIPYESSESEIQNEKLINRIGIIVYISAAAVVIISSVIKKKR